MKSEHRHELAENDLSKLFGRWIEKFDANSNTILTGVIVVALMAAGLIYWTRTSNFQRANGWTQLAASTNPEDYANVADAFSGTPVAAWARLRAANGFLHEGIRSSLSDRPASNDRLEEAREAFASLTASGNPPAVREQALHGLAVTLEATSDGDTQPAITAYQKLLDEFPETRFKDWATDRIDALKAGNAQEFYAWFHAQNPKPADMPLPQDQTGPSGSPLNNLLPELGGTPVPDSGGGSPFDNIPLTVPLGPSGDDTKPTGEEETTSEKPESDE